MTAGSHDPGGTASAARARPTGARRRAALADLVAGLLEARSDPAGERFDAELGALEAAGQVSPEAARLLRYWQRASVRGVVDHARLVLPPALAALDEADEEARRAVSDDSDAWTRATEEPAPPTASSSPGTGVSTGQPTSLEDHRRRLLVAGLTREAGRHED